MRRHRSSAERRRLESVALRELDKARAPVLEEVARLSRRPDYTKGRPAHLVCKRPLNSMRISPLEALAIARAFRREEHLRRKLPEVIARLRRALGGLRESEERQSFDCPLLEGRRCLVHDVAKPVGCAAWHPPEPGEDARFTRRGWNAFRRRDELNDRLYGRDWKLRVIPLWLKRVFARELAVPRSPGGPSGRSLASDRDARRASNLRQVGEGALRKRPG